MNHLKFQIETHELGNNMGITIRRKARVGFGAATAMALTLGGALLLSSPAQAAAPSYTTITAESCISETARSVTWNIGVWPTITAGTAVITDQDRSFIELADGSTVEYNGPVTTSAALASNGDALLTVSGIPANATRFIMMFIVDGNMIGSVAGSLTTDCMPEPEVVVVPPVVVPSPPVVVPSPPVVVPSPPVVVPSPPVVVPSPPVVVPATIDPVVASAAPAPVATTVAQPAPRTEAPSSLALTGTDDVVPLSSAGIVILLGGVAALLFSRRRAATIAARRPQ